MSRLIHKFRFISSSVNDQIKLLGKLDWNDLTSRVRAWEKQLAFLSMMSARHERKKPPSNYAEVEHPITPSSMLNGVWNRLTYSNVLINGDLMHTAGNRTEFKAQVRGGYIVGVWLVMTYTSPVIAMTEAALKIDVNNMFAGYIDIDRKAPGAFTRLGGSRIVVCDCGDTISTAFKLVGSNVQFSDVSNMEGYFWVAHQGSNHLINAVRFNNWEA